MPTCCAAGFASGGAARAPLTARHSPSGGWARSRTDTSRLDTISMPLVLGHAGLAFAGFTCWVSFLISATVPLAWLSVGFLAPAIGLGISTVTVWTPYPARRPQRLRSPARRQPGRTDRDARRHAGGRGADHQAGRRSAGPDARRACSDPPPRWQLAPLVPVLHGLLAITTFLLAMLAAIAAIANV